MKNLQVMKRVQNEKLSSYNVQICCEVKSNAFKNKTKYHKSVYSMVYQ